MGDIKQVTTFLNGGLNSDDAHIAMPNGDYPYAFNVFKGEDGLSGVVVNIRGNRQITYPRPLTLSNTYTCVGSYYNSVTRRAYGFVFSQPYPDDPSNPTSYKYDNRLLCFVEDTEEIIDIFIDEHNYLGLTPYELLTDIRMIESWLFFRTDSSEPKMIDVDMAYNYTFYPAYDDTDPSFSATTGDTYTFRGGVFRANQVTGAGEDPVNNASKWDRIDDCYMDESTVEGSDFYKAFLAIKTPPLRRVTYGYGSDPSASFNNVAGKMFRFTYRYQYFDNSYSVCAAHSDVTRPTDSELYNGEKDATGTVNNYINLSFSLFSPALVKNVELYFQEIGGDWKRLAVIKRRDQSLLDTVGYTYKFYNNESYPALAEGLADIIEDAVPRKAKAQEIINKNVLTYGGCTEGFDNLDKDDIDVTLTPAIKEMPVNATYEGDLRRNNITAGDITELAGTDGAYYCDNDVSTWFAVAPDPSEVKDGDVYKVTINGKTNYRALGASDVDTAAHLATAMMTAISELGFPCAVIDTDTIRATLYYSYNYISESKIYDTNTITSLMKQDGLKTAAYHPYCIFYYDGALRRSGAQINGDTVVYVPSLNEYSPPVTGTNYKWNVNWSVNHEPPSWAKYWRWGKAPNRRCSYFVQYIVAGIADGSTVAGFVKTAKANTVALDISPLQTIRTTSTSGYNCYPNSIIPIIDDTLTYRVRFMTVATTPATPSTLLGNIVDGIYDYPVVGFDLDNNVIYCQDFDFATPTFGINTLIELYVPVSSLAVETYYEIGDLLPIKIDANGNNVHAGTSQDQIIGVGVQAATGTFSSGDVYHIMRTPSKPLCTNAGETTNGAFHESMWYSDFYESDDWDRGKVGVETPVGEQTLNIIRWSNPYLQNTQVNGITTFQVSHQRVNSDSSTTTIYHHVELSDTCGDIKRLEEVGDTLKVYMEKKSASVAIGRTEFQDAEGNTMTVSSDQVLGAVRYRDKNYGTTFPESISKNNKYVYGFDAYQGLVWRDTPNGIFNISGMYEYLGQGRDYKMSSYFKAKAKALLQSGVEHCNVFTVWDERYDMLYVVFKDRVNKENDETVIFHEPSDRWITFTNMSYTPEGGFNEPLELTWSVTRGFALGLNHYFDEASRFEVFNITTGINDSDFPDLDTLTIESFDPTWKADSTQESDLDTIRITSLDPTPVCSYVHIAVAGDTWAADSYGAGNGYESLLTCYPSPAIITAIPSWMEVAPKIAPLAPYSVGDTIPTGTMIVFYPRSANDGAQRTGNITLANSNGGYLDTDSYVAVQNAPITAPTVYVYVDPYNPPDMVFSGLSGSMLPGDDSVNITFTPNHEDYSTGQLVQIYWKFVYNQGAESSSYSLMAEDGISNSLSISLPYVITSGGTLVIYLRGVASTDQSKSMDLSTATITSYDPTPISSACLIDKAGFSFASDADTVGEGQTMTVTASGNPPDNTMYVTIITKPSWLVIWHSGGYALYEGMTISDQETVTLYPSGSNTSYDGRSGTLTLRSPYGDTASRTVSQAGYVAPAQVPIAVTMAVYSNSSSYLTIPNGYYSASGMSGDTRINFSFIVKNALKGEGEAFTLYWRADRTTGGVTATDAYGSFEAVNTVDETVATYANNGYINIASTPLSGDSVTLYVSIYTY